MQLILKSTARVPCLFTHGNLTKNHRITEPIWFWYLEESKNLSVLSTFHARKQQ